MDSNDINNLMLGTLKELGPKRFQQIAETMVVNQKILQHFLGLNTPEKISAHEAACKAEDARLAAIEAAKSPAQKLKEKQAACSHRFSDTPANPSCRLCGKIVTHEFACGYTAGYNNGYDAGRDSVDCDC